MQSVHFGAGSIGRGFIGQLLHESGYDITFVDVQDDMVNALKEEGCYEVILAGKEEEHIPIDRVTALHSERDPEEVTQRLAEADLITTAVGPSVLEVIAPAIAKGLVGAHAARGRAGERHRLREHGRGEPIPQGFCDGARAGRECGGGRGDLRFP